MAVQKVLVTHLKQPGTGQIYLSDVGRRVGLGGGVSIYENGQDCYLDPLVDHTLLSPPGPAAGSDQVELVATGPVLLSIDRGVIYTFVESGDLSVVFV